MMQSENTSRIKKKKGLPSGQAKQVLRKGDFATRSPTTANVITVLEILPIQWSCHLSKKKRSSRARLFLLHPSTCSFLLFFSIYRIKKCV